MNHTEQLENTVIWQVCGANPEELNEIFSGLGKTEVVIDLLRAGADINLQNNCSNCVVYDFVVTVEGLLRERANLT